jgi:hypothetical protein
VFASLIQKGKQTPNCPRKRAKVAWSLCYSEDHPSLATWEVAHRWGSSDGSSISVSVTAAFVSIVIIVGVEGILDALPLKGLWKTLIK